MLRAVVHMILHIAVPAVAARIWYRQKFLHSWMIMIAALAIDLDHLLSSPVYDPNRCSIGFHPLHQYAFIALYALLALVPRTRVIGIGLLIHIFLDGIDCAWMTYE